jgi:arginine utilization regulatory protein
MKAKQYQKLLHDLCQAIKEGVHIVNSEGITIVYNDAMSALEKMRREEVIAKPYREVFSNIPEEESTFTRVLKHQITTGRRPQTYLNKNGKEVSTINTTVPVYDYDGELLAAIEISEDITTIKTLSHTILELQGESTASHPTAGAKIKKYHFSDILGKSKNFVDVLQKAQKAALSSASVLISGETGTGKELFAQSIHYAGNRKNLPFLAQNCAALPESLLEGILFGTVKGGFTGALDRQGLFEQADGGTLLLDEISAMPYSLQSKLLRVLQENYIRRIGGTKDIPIDVRIIATLNEDPGMLIENGRLRRDLYYRLKIIELVVPPLRERVDDIPVLAESFLDKYNKKFDKQIWMISDGAKSKLLAYEFPGNARELENIIMSAVALSNTEHVLAEESLEIPSKGFRLSGASGELASMNGASLDEYMELIEKNIIMQAFTNNGGNISKTANQLGLQRQALQYKLKKYKYR